MLTRKEREAEAKLFRGDRVVQMSGVAMRRRGESRAVMMGGVATLCSGGTREMTDGVVLGRAFERGLQFQTNWNHDCG